MVHDLNVDVPMAYAYADVYIIDDDVPIGKGYYSTQNVYLFICILPMM